jgi:L-threonylcarbamoyladenylate synthase
VILIRPDPLEPDPADLLPAVEALRRGALVAFPTETVYGLGAHALDPAAVARIFAAKGRPDFNPLIVHTATAEGARALARGWPQAAERLAAAFWPGPLTLVVPKNESVPDGVTAGLATVALRVPAHPVAHALLAAAGIPVAAPSANRSTRVSPTTAAHVVRGLGDRVAVVVDGGACPLGIESTVVSLVGDRPTLLRPGSVSLEALREVVGEVALPAAEPGGSAARPSPGMMERHYAPRAELLVMAAGERERLLSGAGDRPTGALLLAPAPGAPLALAVAMPREPAAYAARLYAALHEADEAGCERLLVDAVPDAPAWAAVRDRLGRAAAPRADGLAFPDSTP